MGATAAALVRGNDDGAGSYDYGMDPAGEEVPQVAPSSATSDIADAPAYESMLDTLAVGLDSPPALQPLAPVAGPRRPPSFAEFQAVLREFVGDRAPAFVAELRLIQLARRRDLSTGDCNALIKTLTDSRFVSLAYGAGAKVNLPTSWRTHTPVTRTFCRMCTTGKEAGRTFCRRCVADSRLRSWCEGRRSGR